MRISFVVITALIVCSIAHEHNRVVAVENDGNDVGVMRNDDFSKGKLRDGETSGECDDLHWEYDTTSHTLTISGSGNMSCTNPDKKLLEP